MNKTQFDSLFSSSNSLEIGLKIKTLIQKRFPNIEENIVGGTKVKLALYSLGGDRNVLFGIQQGVGGCMLYVHHLHHLDHERLKFSGKGKHAKRITFGSMDDFRENDIVWLINEVALAAPFVDC